MINIPNNHRFGITLVLMAGVFWSLGGLIVRLMEAADAWQVLFYRSLTIALMMLIVLGTIDGRKLVSNLTRSGLPSVVAGFGIAIAFIGFILSLSYTTVANTFFLLATQPILTAFLAWLLLRERIDRITLIATMMVLMGVSIMVTEGFAIGTLLGNVMGLISALGFTIFTISLRWGKHSNMIPSIFLGSVIATCASAIAIIYNGSGFEVSYYDGGMCAFLGIVQIGFGTWCFTMGSRSVPAAELSLLAMLEIVLGPIWVWLVLAEVPTLWTQIGGVFVLLALSWLGIMRWRNPLSSPISV